MVYSLYRIWWGRLLWIRYLLWASQLHVVLRDDNLRKVFLKVVEGRINSETYSIYHFKNKEFY